MMRAGALDRQVQFQRITSGDDGLSATEVFEDHGQPVWASRQDVSDGEKARAGQVQSNLMTRFRIRHSSFARDITPADQIISEGVTWNITGIKQVDRQRWLEISATARSS